MVLSNTVVHSYAVIEVSHVIGREGVRIEFGVGVHAAGDAPCGR